MALSLDIASDDRVALNGHVTDRVGNCRECDEHHGPWLLPDVIRPVRSEEVR